MVLPAPATVPPIVLFETVLSRLIPRLFAKPEVPDALVPMKFPCTRLPDDVPLIRMPYPPLPEMILRAAVVVPPIVLVVPPAIQIPWLLLPTAPVPVTFVPIRLP